MRQLISSFEASGAAIDSFVATLAPEALHSPAADGEWTGAEVLAHLLQAELVYPVRLAQVLTLDDPVLQAYDQDAWVARFGPVDGPGATLDVPAWVALHAGLRRRLCALLSTLSESDWARGGRHEERGVETVESVVRHLVHHDEDHLAQLRAAVGAAPVA